MSIADNTRRVLEAVAEAAARSGREPGDVAVIGVTKTVGAESIMEMARAGVALAGENRVQELVAKKAALAEELPGLGWHMIGHLQTNKVRQAVKAADMIHSVDSLRLAEAIGRCAGEAGRVMDVLVEVNIAKEGSKFGFLPEEVMGACGEIATIPHINLRGFMCIAPMAGEPLENRRYFERMRKISIDINENLFNNKGMAHRMDVLSMGMTQDYREAILEGATMVRVGTAIFGARQ